MIPLLAQETLSLPIPSPPKTTDPVTWIALALVIALVVLVFFDRRNCREEREQANDSALAERKEQLDAYLAESKTDREAHAAALNTLNASSEARAGTIHRRLDEHGTLLVKIGTKLDV